MIKGCLIGKCSKPVIADCCAKAVPLDDGGALRAPDKLKSKFGRMCRCDYYLVAKGGTALVLIENTDLATSIKVSGDKLSEKLKQDLRNIPEDYMADANDEIRREIVFNAICAEHREKALATLFILEYMRQHGTDSNLCSILEYKSVSYVLLLSNKLKMQHAEIILKIRNSLEKSLIEAKNFHCTQEQQFCKEMVRKKIV